MDDGPLSFDAQRMREIGHQTVDALVDEIVRCTASPVVQQASPAELALQLDGAPPEGPVPYAQVLDQVFSDVTPYRGRPDAPGYLAFIPGFAMWPSVMADLVASGLNLDSCWWAGGAGVSQLELTVLRWFAEWLGYPPDASGVLVSGGSAANLTALACARELMVGAMRDDLVVYISAQSHSSVARAARVLGFRPGRVRVMPLDRSFKLRLDVLDQAIATDRAAGLKPLAVCANAGTTNTGAVDPLPELASLCAAHQVWLHVDAAYGGFAVLTDRGKAALAGIERADSVTLDPHKWLFQPFECGAVLVREPQGLRRAFEILPDYLRDVSAHAEVNFSDRGLQLSRCCRSLNVWMSVRTFGLAAFRRAIDTALDLAQEAAARVDASDELELLAPVQLSVAAFRRRPPRLDDERLLDAVNLALVGAVEQSGEVYVSSTRLFGRQAIRLCVLNPTTTAYHVQRALDIVEATPIDALPAPTGPPPQRHPDVLSGWLARPTVDAATLAETALFAAMDAGGRKELLTAAMERRVNAGEALIEQWDTSRDVFVILDGSFAVLDEGREIGRLGPGDFLGEMAALDWGAGYGPIRAAQVEALTPATVLQLPPESVRTAMGRSAELRELVETTARDRLAALQADDRQTPTGGGRGA